MVEPLRDWAPKLTKPFNIGRGTSNGLTKGLGCLILSNLEKIIGQNILLVLKVYLMSLKLFIPLSVNAYVGNEVVVTILFFFFFGRKSSDIFLVAYICQLNLRHDSTLPLCKERPHTYNHT